MNIEHIKLFARLAVTRNISKAGQELELSPAVASSYLKKLEESLGVRLLYRTTRKVSLTEEGEAFLPHALEVLSSVEAAQASVGAGDVSPRGILRVTAPASFGDLHMMPSLKDFLSLYPEINVDFRFSDSIVDLVEGGFDIAIRNSDLKDSSLIARKLASDKRILCASPEYIKKFGEPNTPQELKDHQCINLTGLEHWVFDTTKGKVTIKTNGRFKSDSGKAIRDACIHGIGITINSKWIAYKQLKNGQLIEVLKDYPLVSDTAIWAVYPSSQLLAPKVRVFIDFFSALYADPPYWENM